MFSTFGSKNRAPEYRLDTNKLTAWSNQQSEYFTQEIASELKIFIMKKAYVMGFNDSRNFSTGSTDNYFHPEFLGGWPHHLWSRIYNQGVKEQERKWAKQA